MSEPGIDIQRSDSGAIDVVIYGRDGKISVGVIINSGRASAYVYEGARIVARAVMERDEDSADSDGN